MPRLFLIFYAILMSGLFAASASAATFQYLFESNANEGPGDEIFIQSFDSFNDVISQTPSGGLFTPLDVSGNFSIGGMMYDGAYHLLFESNANEGPGDEIFIQSFDTYNDLISQTPSGGLFTPLDVSGNFSIGGMMYDGAYHLLFESNANEGPGDEIFIQSFDTFNDLISQTPSGGLFTPLDVSGNFSIGGMAYDGAYHLLFESNANEGPGDEIFIQSFNSFNDLITQTPSGGTFTPLDVSGNFSIRGFTSDYLDPPDPSNPPSTVPLPAGMVLLISALLALLGLSSRRVRIVSGA